MSTYTESKRYQYVVEGTLTFHEYYGILVERLGEESLRMMLPGDRSPVEWRELLDADEHLNNVPLHQWDNRDPYVRSLVQQAGGTNRLAPIIGSGGWSLSDSVCVLKETARRYATEGS